LAPIAIGVDLGQKHDPTAIAVVEERYQALPEGLHRQEWTDEETYTCRRIGRLPLGVDYQDVAERIAGVVRQLRERDHRRWGRWARFMAEDERHAEGGGRRDEWLQRLSQDEKDAWYSWPRLMFVRPDATGLGAPVVDMIRPLVSRWEEVQVQPVTLNATSDLRKVKGGWSVGKPFLVSRLQSLIQTNRLRVPTEADFKEELAALKRELEVYEIRMNDDSGAITTGAFSTGAHDDLVTALGMAVLFRVPRTFVFDNPWA
jgi:hypothetical protein